MLGKLLGCLLAVLVLLLLLFPGLGPVLDHHFAERQPDHAHIYFGPILFRHIHPFEEPHGHIHGQKPEAAPP